MYGFVISNSLGLTLSCTGFTSGGGSPDERLDPEILGVSDAAIVIRDVVTSGMRKEIMSTDSAK